MKDRQFNCESCLWDDICTDYNAENEDTNLYRDECDDYWTGLEEGRTQYEADLAMRQNYYNRCAKGDLGALEYDIELNRVLREFGL